MSSAACHRSVPLQLFQSTVCSVLSRYLKEFSFSGFVDFMSGVESSGALPSSSYRLGVHGAPLHDLYSPTITSALRKVCATLDPAGPLHSAVGQAQCSARLQGADPAILQSCADNRRRAWHSADVYCILQALQRFDKQLPGFITESALLHGVETRTSAPVQIGELMLPQHLPPAPVIPSPSMRFRQAWPGVETYVHVHAVRGDDMQSISTAGLYPAGEGAGYAGGIVSAAVDGLKVGRAVLAQLLGTTVADL